MTYDCILFNNHTQDHSKVRGFGAHRISSVLREQGYTCLVVDFVEYVTVQDYINIIDRAVGDNTVFIGFSTMWFPDPALQVTSWRNDDEDHLDFSDLDDWNHSFTYMTEQRERLPKSTVGRMLFDNTHDFFFQVAKKKKPDIKMTNLELIKKSAFFGAEKALQGESGLAGLDDDQDGQLKLIDFKRIKGGKPFDTSLDWYQSMLKEIGQH